MHRFLHAILFHRKNGYSQKIQRIVRARGMEKDGVRRSVQSVLTVLPLLPLTRTIKTGKRHEDEEADEAEGSG